MIFGLIRDTRYADAERQIALVRANDEKSYES